MTLREIEIAKLTARGFTRNEIAKMLHISRNTVTVHLNRFYEKSGIEDRLDLVGRCVDLEKRKDLIRILNGGRQRGTTSWRIINCILLQCTRWNEKGEKWTGKGDQLMKWYQLTPLPRRVQVESLMEEGMTNIEIANVLGLKLNSVRAYVRMKMARDRAEKE